MSVPAQLVPPTPICRVSRTTCPPYRYTAPGSLPEYTPSSHYCRGDKLCVSTTS
jgi:hypothetical protein